MLSSLPADVWVLGRFAVGSFLQPPRPDTCCSQELLLCSQSMCRRLKPSMPLLALLFPSNTAGDVTKGPAAPASPFSAHSGDPSQGCRPVFIGMGGFYQICSGD